MNLIANRIRERMDERGLTVQMLAEQTGIARMTLTRRLADPGSLRLAELDKLATALDFDPIANLPRGSAA